MFALYYNLRIDGDVSAEQVRHPAHSEHTAVSRRAVGSHAVQHTPHDLVWVQHRLQAAHGVHQLHQILRLPKRDALREARPPLSPLHPRLDSERVAIAAACGAASPAQHRRHLQPVLLGVLQRAVCGEARAVEPSGDEREAAGGADRLDGRVRHPTHGGGQAEREVAGELRVLRADEELLRVQQGGAKKWE